jgi:hypothetical protein
MNASERESDAGPRPACTTGARDDRTWRRDRVTEGLLAFYRPCRYCYGEDGPSEGEEVVRSTLNQGSVLHRPAEAGPPAHGVGGSTGGWSGV